jgi:glycosyltransferase involved in cell wall biosynthesis
MQAGLPVVAAETGEMPYTINSWDVGLTFPVGDVTELAQALEDVLSRPERLAAIGQNARDRVLEKFSQERFDAVAAKVVGRLSVLVAS